VGLDRRRALVEAVVSELDQPDHAVWLLGSDVEDARWIFDRATSTGTTSRPIWARLARHLYRPDEPEFLELWLEYRSRSNAVAQEFPGPLQVVLGSPQAAEMKKWHAEHAARAVPKAPRSTETMAARAERVIELLNNCLAG